MKLTNNLYLYPDHGMLDCNTYVITGSPGIIIDPGNAMFVSEIVQSLRDDGIDPESIGVILNTHLHADHCGGNEAFKKVSGAEIMIHPVQKQYYNLVVVEGARFFGMPSLGFTEDSLTDNERLISGDIELEMLLSPGHSPDSVCFYYRESQVLICGDVVFYGNVGRVDIPGGNGGELGKSIEGLSNLEIEYLLPGHMNIVTSAPDVKRNFDFIRENVLRWL
jgi:glyoxylase-like metal-dependent hydrolase (beta-lactamase superfamily II)